SGNVGRLDFNFAVDETVRILRHRAGGAGAASREVEVGQATLAFRDRNTCGKLRAHAVDEGVATKRAVERAIGQHAIESDAGVGEALSGQRAGWHTGDGVERKIAVRAGDLARRFQPPLRLRRQQCEVGEVERVVEVGSAGRDRTVSSYFNAVVADAQIFDVEAILAASDTALDGGAAGEQIVGRIYAALKIVAGALDDEIERAGQRL